MREIRDYVATLPSDSTCMDEYLKRRKQLIIKFSTAPVLIPAAAYGGVAAGAAAGTVTYALLYKVFGILSDPTGGWKQLGYVILGAGAGGIGAGAYVLTDLGLGVHEFVNNQRILKALMEARHNEVGPLTKKLHQNFLKKNPESPLTVETFQMGLLELDQTGALCDGSLRLKKPRFMPNRLAKRLARMKDLYRHMAE